MPLLDRSSGVEDEIPTAGLADIAFLLLIFFLTTTVFNEEKGLQIVLPEQQKEQEVPSENIMFLIVQPNGQVVIQRGESEQTQTVPYNRVEGILRQELAANPKLIAAVQTTPNAPYRHMVNVLDEVKSAGAERVSLQMKEQ